MVLHPRQSRPIFHPAVPEKVQDFGKQNPDGKTDAQLISVAGLGCCRDLYIAAGDEEKVAFPEHRHGSA